MEQVWSVECGVGSARGKRGVGGGGHRCHYNMQASVSVPCCDGRVWLQGLYGAGVGRSSRRRGRGGQGHFAARWGKHVVLALPCHVAHTLPTLPRVRRTGAGIVRRSITSSCTMQPRRHKEAVRLGLAGRMENSMSYSSFSRGGWWGGEGGVGRMVLGGLLGGWHEEGAVRRMLCVQSVIDGQVQGPCFCGLVLLSQRAHVLPV